MRRTCSSVASMIAVILLGSPLLAQQKITFQFDGDLFSSDGFYELLPLPGPPATIEEHELLEGDPEDLPQGMIGEESAEVLRFGQGTYLFMPYFFEANGGGEYVNQYTLIMDVMHPSRAEGGGWAALYNTNDTNSNDGDWFVNADGGIGISGNYGGSVPEGEWRRLALVVDLAAGTYTSYVDGVQVQQNTDLGLDGRFSLYLDRLLLLADDSGETSSGYINSVQLWDFAMPSSQIAALGGPTAEGIPEDFDPRDCFLRELAVEFDVASGVVTGSWQSLPGDEGFRVLRDGVQIGADLGGDATSFEDPAPPVGGETVMYTLQALIGGEVERECEATVTTFACPSNLVCCVDQEELDVALAWEAPSNLGLDGYDIERDGAVVGSVGAGETAWTDDLSAPGRYAYRVVPTGAGGGACTGSDLACLATVTGVPLREAAECEGVVAHYDLDGDLSSATGGLDLVPGVSNPLLAEDPPDYGFEEAEIGGVETEVLRYGRGTIFHLFTGFGPNGGGAYTNRCTLILDVMFPEGALAETGWAPLFQTNATNTNDGDWFVRGSDGGIGISGNYGGQVVEGEWHRLALALDLAGGTYTSYIDGVQVQQNTGQGLDGRFALYSVNDGEVEGIFLFADDNGENAAGYVSCAQIRDTVLSAGALAALGGATASGIPLDVPWICPVRLDGCVDQEARSVALSWPGAEDLPGVRVLRDGELLATLGPDDSTFSETGLAPGTHVYTIELDGEGSCANFPLEYEVRILEGGSFLYDDFNCYATDDALAAAGWEIREENAPFEDAAWTVTDPGGKGPPPGIDGRPTSGRFIVSDSDAASEEDLAGSGASHDIWSPSFATSGEATVWLHLDLIAQLNNDGDAVFDIDVSTDDGATWTNAFRRVSPGRLLEPVPDLGLDNADGYFGHLDLDISDLAADRESVRIRFRHYEPSNDWWVAIDNVLVDASPVLGGAETLLETEMFDDEISNGWTTLTGPDSDGLTSWNTTDECSLSLLNSGGEFPDFADGQQIHHFDETFAVVDPFCSFSRVDEYLITPTVDAVGSTRVFLHVKSAILPTAGATAQILLSLDGGETFEPEPLFSQDAGATFVSNEEPFYGELVLEVPRAAGEEEVAFAFHYRSAGSSEDGIGRWWAIDDVRVTATTGSGGGPLFRRGDADDSGELNITDGIFVLNFLFLGGPDPSCLDAADADDSGAINITDGIYILNFLFLGGPEPPAPGTAECGLDPDGADDALGCDVYESC